MGEDALRRYLFPVVLCAPLAAATAETGAGGMPGGVSAQRIDEPVFQGQAYVYEAGRGHARTIVLIHGIGANGARDFAELIPWLARDFHVLTFDLPGFGQSSKANALYSPGNYAAFVKHVTDRYARRPFVLLGHSMGGVVALRFAATYPEDVERLVLMSVPGILHRLSYSSQYLAHLGMEFLPSFMSPGERIASLARKLLGRVERFDIDPETVLENPSRRAGLLGGDPARIAGLALVLEDLSTALPRIAAPTLILWGEDDTLAPPRTGRLLAAVMPQTRLVVLPGVAHVPMLEDPPAFRRALAPFLRAEVKAQAPPRHWERSGGAVVDKPTDARCERQQGVVFEGEYGTIEIERCRGVRVRAARIRTLRVLHSTVDIEDSRIGGAETGLYARSSTITVTNGRIEGDVAITALGSRLDLAGVSLYGREAAISAPLASSVVFSVSWIERPAGRRDVHGFYAITPHEPLR